MSTDQEIDPLVAQTIAGRPRYAFRDRLPDPSETKEQKKAIAIENRTARRLKRLVRTIILAEVSNEPNDLLTSVTSIDFIRQKYGFMFTHFVRSFVEEVYRIGAKDALRFDDVAIDFYTTEADLKIIDQWTQDSLNKIFARLEQAIEKQLSINFVFESVIAEISTFVLMESFKEKTKQFLEFVNNADKSTHVQFAKAAKGNPQTYQGLPKDSSTIMFLLNLKGISEVNEMEAFAALRDEDGNLMNEVADITELKDRHYFVWVTARDDKVCKRYCRPLNGIMWSYDDIGLIPLPDMLTHPRCRCMIYKVRI